MTEFDTIKVDEIFDEHDTVFLDTCIDGINSSPDISYDLYPIDRFSKLPVAEMSDSIENLKYILSMVESHPKAKATPAVILETHRMLKNLNHKREFLEKMEIKFQDEKRRRTDPESRFSGEFQRDVLFEMVELYLSIIQQFKKHKFKPIRRDKYRELEKAVIQVTKNTNCDYKSLKLFNRQRENPASKNADSKLVAAAVYSSNVDGLSTGILTRDRDIKNIFLAFLGYQARMGVPLPENPIDIYFLDKIGIANIVLKNFGASVKRVDYSA